ncbi:hypothetical protein C8J57DRAFT_1732442 [Mycena rebaudengoi]|nr:hypothetical protein C8J57DRAFT_1732442 [Mycena rebaudengoi]
MALLFYVDQNSSIFDLVPHISVRLSGVAGPPPLSLGPKMLDGLLSAALQVSERTESRTNASPPQSREVVYRDRRRVRTRAPTRSCFGRRPTVTDECPNTPTTRVRGASSAQSRSSPTDVLYGERAQQLVATRVLSSSRVLPSGSVYCPGCPSDTALCWHRRERPALGHLLLLLHGLVLLLLYDASAQACRCAPGRAPAFFCPPAHRASAERYARVVGFIDVLPPAGVIPQLLAEMGLGPGSAIFLFLPPRTSTAGHARALGLGDTRVFPPLLADMIDTVGQYVRQGGSVTPPTLFFLFYPPASVRVVPCAPGSLPFSPARAG